MKNCIWRIWLPVVLFTVWELAASARWVDVFFFSAPSRIVSTAIQMASSGELLGHLLATLFRLAVSFPLGVAAGVICAALAVLWPPFARSVEPSLNAAYSLPKLTLFPLLVMVFGIGDAARILLVALGVFLLIAVQLLDAIRGVPSDLLEMARNYGAKGWPLVRRVYCPAAMPRLLTALRVAAGRAVVITISTEILGARQGVGSMVWFGWQTLITEHIYIGILLSALIGATLMYIFRLIERRSLVWLPVLLIAIFPASAQTAALIEGRVTDPSGAPIANVAIEVRESQTRIARSAFSRSDGAYRTPPLAPGRYVIAVSHPGFQALIRQNIELNAGRAQWVDLQLSVGETRESITVSSQPALVNTNAADWGSGPGQRKLESLPLNGRDLFALATQQPGANVNLSQISSLTGGMGLAISVNGGRASQNSFRLDGVYINDAAHGVPGSAAGRLLGLESVQELRLVTSPFSAEYGQAAGGVLIAVSKSGTNDLHGAAYNFLRNDKLDARNFFDLDAPPPLRRNQFGSILHGPLRRNKLFFLGNYEGIRDTTSRTVRPATLAVAPRATAAPSVRPFLAVYPLPNGRDFGDGSAEFIAERSRSITENYFAGKLDWVPTDRLRFNGRYTWDRASNSVPDDYNLWNLESRSRYQFLNGEAQWIASPRVVLTTRAGFSRISNGDYAPPISPLISRLTFLPGMQLGTFRVTGLADVGGILVRQRPRDNTLTTTQFNQDYSHSSGSHTFKAGGGFDMVRFDQLAEISKAGYYQFTSIPSLLQGRPQTAEVMAADADAARRWRQYNLSGYFLDDVRLSPRFSLSMGVRWESYTAPNELDGKIATVRNPFTDKGVTIGGPLFNNPSRDNFAPRLSLAWDPFGRGRTVIRAGFGVFFDLLGVREIVVAGVRVPPFFNRAVIANAPFPDLGPALSSGTLDPSVDTVDFDVQQPYVLQQQFELQHQLDSRTVLRAGYAGSRGVHLIGHINEFNIRRPTVLPDGRLFFPATGPRINPNFDRFSTRRTQFNSFFHAFHLAAERRLTKGLGAQFKYTLSKSIDEHSVAIFSEFEVQRYIPTVLDYRSNRGRSNFDMRHAFAANFTAATTRFTGWELHGILTLQSGFAFSPTVGYDRAQLGGTSELSQRPSIGAPMPVNFGTPDRWFDPDVFQLPEVGMLGNLGRNTLTGPGLAALDAALHKALFKADRHALILRVESFNLANRANFQVPSGLAIFNNRNQRLGTAGRITATASTSRQIQLALRWSF